MDQSKESSQFKKFFPKMKDDRYEYLGHLGKGRSGQVFKAKDRLLKKKIVIKVMCSEVPRQEDFQRFQREARAFSSLQHPNILRVLDFGLAEDETPYLVTDFVDGISIAEHLKAIKKFTLEQAVNIAIQLCGAMDHSHKRGVLHRDLKPSNILLTNVDSKKPHVFILDFGLAKFTETHHSKDNTLTRPGQILGTAEYMSPEQAKGGKCSESSDIYSLGCIIFEMLIGKPPFEDRALLEVIRMQCEDEPPLEKLDQFSSKMNVRKVLEKAFRKDPDDRYSSMQEMENDLKELTEIRLKAKATQSQPKITKGATSINQKRESAVSNSQPPASKKLKVLPVALLGTFLVVSFILIILSLVNRDEQPFMNESKVLKSDIPRPKPSANKMPNLAQDALLLTGKLDGTHLTLAGSLGSDQLLVDAARTGKSISLVDASSAPLSDKGMQSIIRISPRTLILTGTKITDESIFRLKNNRRLKYLIIDETDNIVGSSFKIFPTIPNLTILSVGGKNLTHRPFSSLVNCKSLTTVCINSSPNMTDRVFLALGTVPNLGTVYIGDCPEITREGLVSLKKAKPYVKLVISDRLIPVEHISELKSILGSNSEEGFLD